MKKIICSWTGPHSGEQSGCGYIIGGYGQTAAKYAEMVQEARNDFPELNLNDSEITLSWISKSDRYKNMAVIHFPVPYGSMRDGYDNVRSVDFDC